MSATQSRWQAGETHDMIYLSHMKTIFEKIIDREIPADIVYEDDTCMAFLDIAPVRKGHTLLVSKKPYPWVDDVPADEIGYIMTIAQKLIKNMKGGLGIDFVQLEIVGTEVPHFHIHLIPHKLGVGEVEDSHHRPVDQYESPEEKQYYIDQLKKPLR